MEIDVFNPDTFIPGVPHHMFDEMRRRGVYFHEQPGGPGFWCLTRYEDVVKASEDYVTFSSARGTNIEDAYGGAELMMVNMDPPQHTRLRNLVQKGFTARQIRRLEEHIVEVAASIIDGVAGKGECDFVTDVAAELPLQVIAELIGVPMEDRHKIFNWSNRMIGMDDPEYGNTIADARQAAMEMWQYTEWLASERRGNPREDVVSILAEAEVDGHKLDPMDLNMFFLLLAVAGNETTRNLISGGTLALLENPDQKQRLVDDPSLVRTAVEEMLRWVTPVMHFRRTATCDTEIGGEQIKAGDKVLLWYIAADRDPEVFENPHTFDVGRDPNVHVGFGGGGPHFCLGATLARVEIRAMFHELLKRLPSIELDGDVQRLRSNFINGIKHMPVKFEPESARRTA